MTRRSQNSIVIDADVGCSSSRPGKSLSAYSLQCFEILDAILGKGLYIVLTPEILSEWDDHASYVSVKWLGQMRSRGQCINISAEVPRTLGTAISALPGGLREIAVKDEHLLAAAIARGKRVISNDKKARRVFVRLATSVAVLEKVHWCGPGDEWTLQWILNGAKLTPRLWLSAV